jgi:hypothetical protein
MAPECVEVYLRWNLENYLENLNPLKPLQDFPSFYEKIEIKIIKKVNNQDQVRKKLSNNKSLEVNVAISQKNLSCMIFHKKNDRKQNERKS